MSLVNSRRPYENQLKSLAADLETAEGVLIQLIRDANALTPEAVAGEDGAQAKLDKARAAVKKQRQRVTDIKTAIVELQKRIVASLNEVYAGEDAKIVERLRAVLAERDQSAVAEAALLAQVIAAHRVTVAKSHEALKLVTTNAVPHAEFFKLDRFGLSIVLGGEIYRLQGADCGFPGGVKTHTKNTSDPKAEPAFVDVIRDYSAYALRELEAWLARRKPITVESYFAPPPADVTVAPYVPAADDPIAHPAEEVQPEGPRQSIEVIQSQALAEQRARLAKMPIVVDPAAGRARKDG